MAVNLSPIWGAGAQLLDNSGNVLSGGKIYTYAAGTTTQVATYTSNTGVTANSNPIVLNSAGRVPYEIWLTDGQNYKFVLKDSNDVLIGTWDNLSGINSNFVAYTNQQEIQTATAGQTVFNLTTMQYLPGTGNLSVFVDGVNQYGPGAQYAFEETNQTTVTFASGLHVGASVKFTSTQIQNAGVADASQISYTYPATNAVTQNVEERLAQYVSVKDFGAVGDGVTDDTVAIQNAIDYAQSTTSTLKSVHFPSGTYLISDTILIKGFFSDEGLLVFGDNAVVQSDATFGGEQFNVDALTVPDNLRCNVRFQNLNFYGPGKSVVGSRAIIIEASSGGSFVTADVWVKDCVVSGFESGIVSLRGILLDFQNVTLKHNALAFSSPNLSNSINFASCRFISNDRAMYFNNFTDGEISFNSCEIEGNAIGGTSTDGVKCCEFTNAGHLTFNSCHFESNDCQYNIYYVGTANQSSITFVGCEVLAGLGAQVYATGAAITSVGSFISSGASTYDMYLGTGSHATLIDSYTTTQGPNALNISVFGGFTNQVTAGGTSINFGGSASLQDYQEGTWTGGTISGTNCSSVVLSNAKYVKIGKLVQLQGTFAANLTSSGTAINIVFNAPFATVSNASPATGAVAHTATTNGIGIVEDNTSGEPSTLALIIPANQVTASGGSAFTANFSMSYISA